MVAVAVVAAVAGSSRKPVEVINSEPQGVVGI